jgi:hypothetical protein
MTNSPTSVKRFELRNVFGLILFLFYFQLFEHCLAPDTMGDGTGCDNMTAVIVKFKPGFKTVKDSVSEPTNSASSGSTDVSENGVKRAGEDHETSKNGGITSEPSSKKVKLDSSVTAE